MASEMRDAPRKARWDRPARALPPHRPSPRRLHLWVFALLCGFGLCPPASTQAQTTITRTIAAGSDDAEEQGPDGLSNSTGHMFLTSSDIELVVDFDDGGGFYAGTQKVGLRFTGVSIPVGAIITDAYLTFRAIDADAPMSNSETTNLTIKAQLAANPTTFTTTNSDISSRTLTTASTSWAPGTWTTNTDYDSPSIATVIQEVVNQAGWASGNAIAIIITGTGHRASPSHPTTPAELTVTFTTPGISGRVFEDVNYGGGAGRNWATASGAGGSARSAARVELFTGAGAFVTSTTTDGSGNYTFSDVGGGNYLVRVVSSSVTSSRTGYVAALIPVMTFRTDASTGTAVGVTDYVGGHDPATADAGNAAAGWTLNSSTGVFSGSGSGKAHAFAPVTVSAASVTGVDFGWNFDTVVTTRNTGQGSLRRFLVIANTLGGDASLAQSGLVAAKENAVFMISNGTAAPGLRTTNNYFSGGVATITPSSALPAVSTPVVINAQKQPGWSAAPIVVLNGLNAGSTTHGLNITGGGCVVRGLVINDFTYAGVNIDTGNGNVVAGNYIGTDAAGTTAVPNGRGTGYDGILIGNTAASTGNVIGGPDASDRNLISGNIGGGIWMVSTGANTIRGNYIGVDVSGSAALGNGQHGIILAGSGNNVVDNLISGNGSPGYYAVYAPPGADDSIIQGNRIGVDATGAIGIPNVGDGIHIESGDNLVGGTTLGQGNIIAFSTGNGIVVDGGALGNGILGNTIYANTDLGIDLDGDGATPNNGTKNAALANSGMDYPVFTSATLSANTLTVAGYVGSLPNQATFAGARVEVFESDGDLSTFGEGKTYLDSLTTDANGNFSGALDVTGKGLTAGDTITGTATDGSNNTSEFGDNATVLPAQPLVIVKRAFDLAGAPIPTGTVLPKGAVFAFLLYVSNPGLVASDATLSDALDAAFEYQSGTIRYDNAPLACASGTCTPAEEAAIFSAVTAGTLGTDAIDGDPVSRSAATIHAGNQTVANAQLDLAGGRVWAVLFRVRMR